jgi:putative NADH-flavin reductase
VAPGGYSLTRKTDLYTQSAKVILAGMAQNRVERLLVISTAARREYSPDNHPFFELILKRLFWRTLYENVVDMDDMITASALNWTLVRPPQVVNKPQMGKYRVAVGQYAIPGGATIGRADLAAYMVSIIKDERLYRQNVAIAY